MYIEGQKKDQQLQQHPGPIKNSTYCQVLVSHDVILGKTNNYVTNICFIHVAILLVHLENLKMEHMRAVFILPLKFLKVMGLQLFLSSLSKLHSHS